MADYRYLCANLVTNQIIAEIPFTGVSYSQELNSAGSFSGHILLTDIRETDLPIDAATTPSSVALYVERNGQLVWGGIIWSRTYDSQTQALVIGAREFESYYEHRVLQFGAKTGTQPRVYDYTGAWTYNTDIFTVIQDCLNAVHGWQLPNSDIGIIVPTNTLGQTVGDVATQYGYKIQDFEFRPVLDVLRALSQQTNGQGGFDFNIDVAYAAGGTITKTMELTARRGTVWSSTSTTAPMLEFPGNMVAYSYPEDGTSVANVTYGQGDGGSGGIWYNNPSFNSFTGLKSVSSKLTANMPLLERVVPVVNERNPNVVASLTQAAVEAWIYPITTLTCTWDSIDDPQIGTFKTGDQFRIRITDERFPNTNEFIYRLSKFEVEAGENNPERIIATFVNPLAFGL